MDAAAANASPWLSTALPLSSDDDTSEDSDCDGGDATAGAPAPAQSAGTAATTATAVAGAAAPARYEYEESEGVWRAFGEATQATLGSLRAAGEAQTELPLGDTMYLVNLDGEPPPPAPPHCACAVGCAHAAAVHSSFAQRQFASCASPRSAC